MPVQGCSILCRATPWLLRNILHGPAATHFPVVPLHGVQQERTHGTSLDWQLHEHGHRFVRYADDFVVLAQTESRLHEAFDLVQRHLTSLGLTLSAEKTKQSKFREGFTFLGFAISSWSVTMRPKSVEKFKTKIRDLTPRHHNLDQDVITKLNRVIRGTANYFVTPYSEVGALFRGLDRWIRMRLRCMKYKRKSRADNGRFRLRYFRSMGLLSLSDLRPAPA